jgi:hypothetical protein
MDSPFNAFNVQRKIGRFALADRKIRGLANHELANKISGLEINGLAENR